ncbi:hypothetical protein V8E54_005310 [Elaphomyces granulatus]
MYIDSEMGKGYNNIDRVVAKWEKSRRNEIEEAKASRSLIQTGSRHSEEAGVQRIAQNEQSKMAMRMSDRWAGQRRRR